VYLITSNYCILKTKKKNIIKLGIKFQPRQTVDAAAVHAGQTTVDQIDETKAGQTSRNTLGQMGEATGGLIGNTTMRETDESTTGKNRPEYAGTDTDRRGYG